MPEAGVGVAIILAAGLGIISVQLFALSWLGVLGLAATAIMRARRSLSGRETIRRLARYAVQLSLCATVLLLAMKTYMNNNLGRMEIEQFAYFVAIVPSLLFNLLHMSARIDELFSPEKPGMPEQDEPED